MLSHDCHPIPTLHPSLKLKHSRELDDFQLLIQARFSPQFLGFPLSVYHMTFVFSPPSRTQLRIPRPDLARGVRCKVFTGLFFIIHV